MKKQARWYQRETANAIVKCWREDQKNVPYANNCTGSGKSLTLAMLTNYYINRGERVLQLVPTMELVKSNKEEAIDYLDNPEALGIVCNQLKENQNHRQAVIAMMASFLNKRAISGAFDILLIDECDLVNNNQESSYRRIITSLQRLNPNMLIAGLTATPYTQYGLIHENNIQGQALFTHCVYETPVARMIKEGYLSHVESISGDIEIDTSDLKMSGYDYNVELMGVKFDAILQDGVADMKAKFKAYNIETAIIYASTIANAERIVREFGTDEIRISHGKLTPTQRKHNIEWLNYGNGNRYLVNVGLYIRGFNYPQLRCVVFFLATQILRKYVQICGRVIRAHEEKSIGYVLDYGGNIERHGPIDETIVPKTKKRKNEAPKKICTAILDENVDFEGVTYLAGNSCNYLNNLSARKCKKCEALFISDNEEGKYSMRTKAQVLALEQEKKRFTYDVESVLFERHQKGDVAMIKMLFYDKYELLHTEYICIEHTGSARGLAIAKLKSLMKNPRQDWYQIGKFEGSHNVKNMLFLLENYYDQYFKCVKAITIIKEGRFNKLEEWFFDEQNYAVKL